MKHLSQGRPVFFDLNPLYRALLLSSVATLGFAMLTSYAQASTVVGAQSAVQASTAQTEAEVKDLLPLAPGIEHYVLPNGLAVYLFPRNTREQTYEMRLVVRAGSLQEVENERGLAHFVEHMAFNGTTHFPDQTLFKSFEKEGIQLGADVNAITSLGTTVFKLSLPARANLDHAISAFSEWATGLLFEPHHFERERGVIIEEWRLRQSAGTRINNALQALRYRGSLSEFRDPIGLLDVVRTAPVERAKAFYHRWYQPQNMALIMVGDFDAKKAKQIIDRDFGALKNTGAKTPEDWGRITRSLTPKESTVVVTDPEQSSRFVQIMLQEPLSVALDTQNGQWRDTLEQITLDILSKRLDLVAESGEIGHAQLTPASTSLSPYLTQVLVIGRPKPKQNLAQVTEVVAREIKRLVDYGPTPDELKAAIKARMERVEIQAANQARITNADWARTLEEGVSNKMPMLSKRQNWQMNQAFTQAIMTRHIQAAALALLTSVVKIGGVAPSDGKTVSADALRKAWDEGAHMATKPFALTPKPPVPLDVSEPSYQKPRSQQTIDIKNGATVGKTIFQNGATLLVMSDPALKGSVKLMVRVKGGTSVVDDGVTRVPTALSLPMKCGLGSYRPNEVVQIAKQDNLRLISYAEQLHHGLRGQGPIQNLPSLMSLLKLRLNKPIFCDDALEEGRNLSLEAFKFVPVERRFMEAMLVDGFVHGDQIDITPKRILSGGDAQAMAQLESKLLGDPSRLVISVVGSAPYDQLYDETAPWVATLVKRNEGFKTWRDLGVVPNPQAKDKVYAWSSSPKTMVQIQYISPATWSNQGRIEGQLMGIVANLRLREALRTELSGVYTVSLSPLLVKEPTPYFQGRLNFSCAPEHAALLIAKAKEVMKGLAKEGMTQAEFKEAQATLLHQEASMSDQMGYWVEALAQTMGDDAVSYTHLTLPTTERV